MSWNTNLKHYNLDFSFFFFGVCVIVNIVICSYAICVLCFFPRRKATSLEIYYKIWVFTQSAKVSCHMLLSHVGVTCVSV